MGKSIDLTKTVFEICRENPDVLDIMKDLGFENIASPGMLNTVGRFTTIPKGAEMKHISLDEIKKAFRNKGYEIES